MVAPSPARLLVVEDDAALMERLCEQLRTLGHTTVGARTVADGLERLGKGEFDVALVDLVLPDGSGTDVLRRIKEEVLPTESIVLTDDAGVDAAIEAMKLGAYDFMTKPARMNELEVLVQKAAEKARLRQENTSLRVCLGRQERGSGLITEDPAMKELMATVARVAASDLPVLVQGENGTGKELVARAIHTASPRSSHPFVAIECAGVAESLLESELFGHEKDSTGAVTGKPGLFEVADRGVLFLDEIGEVSPAVQGKLLRALETREVVRVGSTRPVHTDVRVVSATHKDVKAEMQEGRFREDLYERLNGVTIRVPPLRERRGDIPVLARHFLGRVGPRKQLSSRALETLAAYAWPGNVRELQMVIHRAAILAPKDTIDADDLPLDVRDQGWKAAGVQAAMKLADVEREYIESVLRRNQGHRGKTARALGIDPKTLYNKLGPERPRKKAERTGT